MYFQSRVEAGQLLSKQLVPKYQDEECAVIALNDGGVMVGAQIALELKCVLTLLLTDTITIPREDMAIAGINQDGSFTFNHSYSQGQIDDFTGEYYHFIEQEKMNKMQAMHRLSGRIGLIRKDLIQDRNIILVTDGLIDGFALDIAMQYLKPIHTKRIIVATPLASVKAVDRMHILADEIACLSVIEDYISTDHYYETQDIPPHDKVIKTVEQIVAHWKNN